MTKNESWLRKEGWPVVRDSADFFASRAVACNSSSCTLGGGVSARNLTYLSVVAPDESAGRHDSSAYTNGIAVTVLDFALECAALLGVPPTANWSSVSQRLYLPITPVKAGAFMTGTLVHPEFQGYNQTQRPHINQADVALLQYPLGLRSNKRVFPPIGSKPALRDTQLAINDLLFWQPKSDNQVFYTGDSAYSIAWLEMGNRTAADSQFDLAFTHMDLQHFLVFEENNRVGDYGHTNFITGAGGYLQNFINGYAGLRYTKEGLNLRPVLPPHNVSSMKLRGLSLAGSRMDVYYEMDANIGPGGGFVTITLTSGPGVTVHSQGAPDSKLLPGHAGGQAVTLMLCKTCGCGCPGGGCGCLIIKPGIKTDDGVETIRNAAPSVATSIPGGALTNSVGSLTSFRLSVDLRAAAGASAAAPAAPMAPLQSLSLDPDRSYARPVGRQARAARRLWRLARRGRRQLGALRRRESHGAREQRAASADQAARAAQRER